MRPTSIVVAGGGTETASIRAAGGVEFANATSLSLNGVFTADYDNYMIVCRHLASTGTFQFLLARLRSSGTDATGSNYVYQQLVADGTSVVAGRSASVASTSFGFMSGTSEGGDTVYIYGPALAQPTAFRSVNVYAANGATLNDQASTHSLSTSYDGITLFPAANAFSGLVTVYGLAQ